MENKMKIEIWSDVMCPFCYIGKRKFEAALSEFPDRNHVTIEWKSYQLTPHLKTEPGKNMDQFLAEKKGISLVQAKAMNAQVSGIARDAGLVFNFDRAIPANTFNAHRMIHFAKHHDRQEEAEEILFRSYFTDGKNIDDLATLTELGKEIGLDANALQNALKNESYEGEVRADIREAQEIGVQGVPFFVFNQKYAVSGAQEPQAFLQTLQKSFSEWRKANPAVKLEILEGNACTIDGNCN